MAYVNRRHFTSAWILGIQWVIANTTSWIAAFFPMSLISYIPSPFGVFALSLFWNKSLPGIMAGVCFATTTWLVLRQRILNPGRWVISTILGFMFGMFIGDGVSSLVPYYFVVQSWRNSPWDFALTGVLLGLLIGAFQWLVLKQQSTQAHWWIPANIAAWTSISLVSFWNSMTGLVVNGIIIGIITRVPLIWVLRNSKSGTAGKASEEHASPV